MKNSYRPEGSLIFLEENLEYISSLAGLEKAFTEGRILESTVLLCDSSKFGTRASFKQGELCDVDCFISDGDKAKKFARFDNKIELL